MLRLLAELGTGFDCASKQEIQQIRDMGVDSTRIIYAQPCKTNSFIRYAKHQQVKQMTFDNAEELYKIKQNFPAAELYLRIFTDDSSSLCRLSLKFGAAPQDAAALLELAKDLDLSVVGVSFHVGSGATDPNAFIKAIKDARFVFDQAALVGYHLGTLDIGGGFSDDTFEMMASVISPCLDLYFPPQIRIIGEPGRYYVSKAFQLACNVIARRPLEDPITGVRSYMLYVNDGVYGNFSSMMFDHQNPVPKILRRGHHFLHGRAASEKVEENKSEGMIQYSIWGPTCDGIDCISASCWLPGTLGVGDWLYFENMGGEFFFFLGAFTRPSISPSCSAMFLFLADQIPPSPPIISPLCDVTAYTMCSATRFNGFTNEHDVIYVSSEAGATALLDVN